MTTLKSFQAEIEHIASEKQKIAIKEAREAHAAAELAKHHGKLPVKKDAVEEIKTVSEDVVEVPIEVCTAPPSII